MRTQKQRRMQNKIEYGEIPVIDMSRLQLMEQFIIRLELKARLWPNIGFTLWGNLAVFTYSAITPP